MTDANNNIELNTKPLSPEVVLPVGEVAAPKIAEEVETHSTNSQEKAQKLKDTVGKFTV